jgi:Reverse transcriptase (RNA-dependent DNA polymerase)
MFFLGGRPRGRADGERGVVHVNRGRQAGDSRRKGRSFLLRYADDFVMGFSHEEDVRWVLAVLTERFAKYGLIIHPDKTWLVLFEWTDRGPTPPDEPLRAHELTSRMPEGACTDLWERPAEQPPGATRPLSPL